MGPIMGSVVLMIRTLSIHPSLLLLRNHGQRGVVRGAREPSKTTCLSFNEKER